MKTLLAIIEQGGYPDFSALYDSLGYKVITVPSMRKALSMIKQHKPDVITAEFIYSPMYSARISNLESLFAALQSQRLKPQILIFTEREKQHHLDKLDKIDLDLFILHYPLNKGKILNCLSIAACS